MPTISLFRFSAGTTGYIGLLNINATITENALNALFAGQTTGAVAGGGGGTGTATTLVDLWDRNGFLGVSAFALTCMTSQTLSATSGAAWHLNLARRGAFQSNQILNFGGKSSGIYAVLVDTVGTLTISAASAVVAGGNFALYNIEYKAPDFGSAERVAPILLHGDDYNRSLSGPIYGSFARLADRLSAIEGGGGGTGAGSGVSGAGGTGVAALYAQATITASVWTYLGGLLRDNNLILSTVGSTLPLEVSNYHYIEVAISNATVSYAVSGWTSSNAIPIRLIRTCSGTVSYNADVRTWAIAGGGGGGTPGLENSGTTDGIWKLYKGTGITSSPVSDVGLVVVRGSAAAVQIRWNETTDHWQFTNDGSLYTDLGGTGTLDLGGGRIGRLMMTVSAPAVLAATGLSTSGTAALISLSAYTSVTTTAALLRGTAFDSALSNLVGASTEPFPGVAFYRDSGTVVAGAAAKIVADYTYGKPETPQTLWVPVASQTIQYVTWAASNLSLRVSAYLVAYIDTVQGVGTQVVSATKTGLAASVGNNKYLLSTGDWSAVANRALVHYLEVSGTLGAGSTYDVELYGASAFSSSDLLFQAITIDASAAYVTRLPFMYRDTASTGHVHLVLSNMGASAGTFSVKWVGEQYA